MPRSSCCAFKLECITEAVTRVFTGSYNLSCLSAMGIFSLSRGLYVQLEINGSWRDPLVLENL
uniref:Putative ovule protein n=1 Tax=Solanum chacoense TaxID=4108 RepID=A0A0V0GZV9_SOLCH